MYYYILFLSFTVLASLIIIDANVGDFINLSLRFLSIQFTRFFWLVKYHPNNFVTTWIRNRQYDKIAKELREELDKTKH